MASRTNRAQIARETLEILDRGSYLGPDGQEVSIRDDLADSLSMTLLYRPGEFKSVFRARDRILLDRGDQPETAFEVANETTLSAARRLLQAADYARVLALNFASAKNPGGGFLKGSQAQEESLARASGLYACINPIREYYDSNRLNSSCLYTDHMIYSPDVPVFRDDDDALMNQPVRVSIVTAPATNAGAIRHNQPHEVAQIEPIMRSRIDKLLALAVVQGHDSLVLGAWGCGVFANDPDRVAEWFADHLQGPGVYRTAFRRVVFAVLDRTPDRSTIRPFATRFSPA